MEKAEFIGSAIEHDIWIGIILGPDKMRFFRGKKLQPFLTRLDATINTKELQPLYVEYPDSELEYMPVYDNIFLSCDISINNIRIHYKELNSIKKSVGRILTYRRRLRLNKVQLVLAIIGAIIAIIMGIPKIIGLLF